MRKVSKRVQATQMKNVLKIWAEKHEIESDPYVVGLLDALSAGGSISFWATLSPFEFLPQKLFSIPQERILRFARLLKNILIFLPVAFTWSAIGRATSAYQLYNSANPNKVSNFLDFWQNGYGYLGSIWKIGSVAALDALIILILIILVFSIHVLEEKNQKVLNTLQHNFESERFSLALTLSQFLFERREITDLTLKDSVADSLFNLKSTAVSIDSTSKNLAKLSQSSSFSKYVTLLKKFGAV